MTAGSRPDLGAAPALLGRDLLRSADGGEEWRVHAFMAAALPLVVVDTDERVLAANAALAAMAGTDPDGLVGSSLWQVLRGSVGQQSGTGVEADAGAGGEGGDRPEESPSPRRQSEDVAIDRLRYGRALELLWVGPLGDRRRFLWTFTLLSPAHPGILVGVGVDITQHRMNEATWQRRARTDPLTGLANRTGFELMLADLLDPERGLGCGLLFCDLDGFKQVNDTYGHAVGDHLLIQSAQRLTSAVREGDLVARLGGDEFVVLIPGAGVVETRATATRLERAISRPVRVDAGTVRVGVSIGHRVAEVGEDPTTVLHDADMAMYAVKARRGRAVRTA